MYILIFVTYVYMRRQRLPVCVSLQDYMREQCDNFLSCDLVAETTRFLGYVYSNINAHNVELLTELLQALVEFVSVSRRRRDFGFGFVVIIRILYFFRYTCRERFPDQPANFVSLIKITTSLSWPVKSNWCLLSSG